MFTLGWKAGKEGFFDRARVQAAVDKRWLAVAKEWGRNVRKAAQKSLRYGDRPSSPGSPPTAHKSNTIRRTSRSTGKSRLRKVSFLREYIWFAYDFASRAVVVGPARLNSTTSADAPAALEHGGPSTIEDRGRKRRVQIRARPFMGPAAQAENDRLPAMWRNSVR